MGTVATITIGSDTFSVYALTADPLTDANSYFAGSLNNAVWTAATDDTKKQGLVTASRLLDRSLRFSGTKTSESQPREHPRDNQKCGTTAVPNGTTPDDIALGSFELAQALIDDPTSLQENPTTASNVRKVKAGSAEVEFFIPERTSGRFNLRLPLVVAELVSCYTENGSGSSRVTAGGTTDTSTFTTGTNDFTLTEPGFS